MLGDLAAAKSSPLSFVKIKDAEFNQCLRALSKQHPLHASFDHWGKKKTKGRDTHHVVHTNLDYSRCDFRDGERRPQHRLRISREILTQRRLKKIAGFISECVV